MNRLDEIKSRAKDAVTTRNGVAHLNGTFLVHSVEDVSSLAAAVEAVLALHKPETIDDDLTTCGFCDRMLCGLWGADTVRYPCPTVTAIREALGETE